ncbi:MAG: hypothetical protein ACI4GO_09795 [Hominenteromicrobium sp.]
MSKGKGRADARKKKKLGGWILLSVLTTLNLLLSLLLRISDRKRVLQAVQEDERLSLLYTGEKTTKTE